jgi:prophage tail gpP-like protein
MKQTGIGIDRDVVTITLGDKVVRRATSYQITMSTLTQPAAFSVRLGSGEKVQELLKAGAPNQRFELRVDGALQFVGRCDGPSARQRGSGATEVTIRGRDNLAPLHDSFLEDAQSFSDITYVDLVLAALKAVAPGLNYSIQSDDAANRKAVTGGAKTTSTSSSSERRGNTTVISVDAFGKVIGLSTANSERVGSTELFSFDENGKKLIGHGVSTGFIDTTTTTTGGSQRTIQGHIGERWYEKILKPELDRVGLCLWAAGEGTYFILAQPNTTQAPIYRLENRRGSKTSPVRVLGYDYKNETTTRYSRCDVHFRAGGDGVTSRTRDFGQAFDLEMGNDFEIPRALTVKDDKCKSIVQADFLARRKICESRRANWGLTYYVAGHTTIGLDGSRLVWSNNTIVQLEDDELGLSGNYYIEGVTLDRGPETMTTLKLLRPDDMLFGEPEEAIGGSAPKKKGKK